MRILGLNAYHGDASAALLEHGVLRFAVEEERFNRAKHWAGLPKQSARACLGDVPPHHIAISRDPKANAVAKIKRLLARPASWANASSRIGNNVRVADIGGQLAAAGVSTNGAAVHYVEHHRAHLASAFFCSPFDEAAVISIDGFGDFSSVMWGVGRGNRIEIKGAVLFPHSLGLFYTAFTQYLGFPKYGDEYKMMGMSAYGEPRFVEQVRDVVRTEKDQVRLNLAYFTHHSAGVQMTWDNSEPVIGSVYSKKMVEVFGPPRVYRGEFEQRHYDLAASVQSVFEENYFSLLNYVQRETGQKAVCLAGGAALNCVANGMIFDRSDFSGVFIQPAAHDAGTAIGAALHVQHQVLNHPRSFFMRHVYYGAQHSDNEILHDLKAAQCEHFKLTEDEILDRTVAQIANGKTVGWFQGRMEFGPRALGNRSILADPRRSDMKDLLNARIKYREEFRPFCPSVLSESVGDYFETDYPSPFMVMAYRIKPAMRAIIPAVTHNDGTGRLQTVEKEANPLYWKLIRRFGDATGVPLLLNTSFNENEPIVSTPAEAIDCFLRTRMDALAIGSFFLLKSDNLPACESRTSFAGASRT
jgi:carbamoyltransferase